MASLVWTDGVTTVNFETAFGVLPQIDLQRAPEHEPMTGDLIKVRWTVTVRGTIRTSGATTALRQQDITDKLETLLAFTDGTTAAPALLTFSDNAAAAAWGFDNSAAQINLPTMHGLKVGPHDLPYRAADYVTNKQYTMTFFADVIECTDKPFPGTAGSKSTTLSYDDTGLIGITFSGILCACDGGNIDALLEGYLEVLRQEAIDRFLEAGYEIVPEFSWRTLSIEETDTDICRAFHVTFAIVDNPPPGTSATFVRETAQRTTVENGIVLTVTGVYGFKDSNFAAVCRDAEEHAGIDRTRYYPRTGAGRVYLLEQEDVGFDMPGHTITATRRYLLIWRHDADITGYEETASIQHSRQGFTSHRLTLKKQAALAAAPVPPLAYCQTSGLDVHIVTFLITITSITEYKEMGDRLTPDGVNIWRIEPDPLGVVKKRVNVHDDLDSGFREYVATVTQTYAVRDIEIADLGAIPCVGFAELRSLAAGAGVRSQGSVTGHGGFV